MDITKNNKASSDNTITTKSVNNGIISTPIIVKGDVFERLVNAQRRTQKEMSTHIKNFTAVSGGPQGIPIENFEYGEETIPVDNINKIDNTVADKEFTDACDGNLVTFHERENFAIQQENQDVTVIQKKQEELPSEELFEREAKTLYVNVNKKPVDSLVELLNARLPKNQVIHPIKL